GKGLLYGIEAKRVRKLETRLGRECAGVTFVTEPESEIYRSFMPTANIKFAVNGIDLDYFDCDKQHYVDGDKIHAKQSEADVHNCLFVGALDYPPNVQGLLWFQEHVWPTIQQRFPRSGLQIVGRNPAPEIVALDHHMNIQIHANVPDVRPYYYAASVAIAPLKIARGLQNKILEAFAMKTPVISTPYAVEGLSIKSEHAMIASEPQEWVNCINQLFHSEADRTKYANAGHDFVKTNHSWETCLQPFAELLNI
ncbi:glycosyltransferase, partial [bacterium]|nr:glycosyltransferase [bacterium]